MFQTRRNYDYLNDEKNLVQKMDPLTSVVQKANPYHDKSGHFSSKDQAATAETADEHRAASKYHMNEAVEAHGRREFDLAAAHRKASQAHTAAERSHNAGDAEAGVIGAEARQMSQQVHEGHYMKSRKMDGWGFRR